MSFFKRLRRIAHTTERDLSAVLSDLRAAIDLETSGVTKSLESSILDNGRFVSEGLETTYNSARVSSVSRTIRNGQVREFGELTGNGRLAGATDSEVAAVRASIIRDQLPDIHIKSLEDGALSARNAAGGGFVDGRSLATLNTEEVARLRRSVERLEDARGSTTRELVGTFIKIGAGAAVIAVLVEATQARNGCWVSQTNAGRTTSCKVVGPTCPNETSPFYETCPQNVIDTLISPFYIIKTADGDLKKKIETAAGEAIPTGNSKDLSDFIRRHEKAIGAAAPEVLTTPGIDPSVGCDSSGCLNCDSTAAVYSDNYVGTTNSTLTITCIRNSTIIDTLMDLAGGAAAAVIDPIINPSGAAKASSGTSGKGIIIALVVLFLAFVVFFFVRK